MYTTSRLFGLVVKLPNASLVRGPAFDDCRLLYIYIYNIFFSLRILHALLRFCRPLLIEMISSRKPMFHVYRKGRTRHPGRYASRTMECGVHGTRFDYRPACNCNQKLWRCGGVYFHSPTELHETIRGPSDRSRFKLPGQHVFGSFEN